LHIFIARLRATIWREAVMRDIDEEMRIHIEMETDANIEKGLTPDVARRSAQMSFGNLGWVKDAAHEVRGGGILETVWWDIRYAVRSLGKTWGSQRRL
jgi:putative ABC transport system permease protein